MKKFLVIAFLLAAFFCHGQSEIHDKKQWKDTVAVMLLVCDTSRSDIGVYWINAFSVRNCEYKLVDVSVNPNKITYDGWGYSSTLMGWHPVWKNEAVYKHSEYLDSQKKPLPKSVIIWQSVQNNKLQQ